MDERSAEGGPRKEVVYVKQAGNGMATAAMVLGIIGTVLGLVPFTAVFALGCGVLAFIFGFVGLRKAKRDDLVGGRGKAIAGIVLGVVSTGLAIIGIVILADAVDEFDRITSELDDIDL